MIKYKGLQVIPSELTGKLLERLAVEDACVVGKWMEEMVTEVPVAFVVLSVEARTKKENEVAEGVNSWFNQRVANHKKCGGGIVPVDAIPKSASGKILRR
jgi:4-coumarate--CoA ligase